MDYHLLIIRRLRETISSLLVADPGKDYAKELVDKNRAILARTEHPSAIDPKNLGDENLPAIFYGYGSASDNPDVSAGSEFGGETLSFLLNVSFGIDSRDNHLIDTSARWHDAVASIIPALGDVITFPNPTNPSDMLVVPILEARLATVETLTFGLSDLEELQFTIEIDWTYPL